MRVAAEGIAPLVSDDGKRLILSPRWPTFSLSQRERAGGEEESAANSPPWDSETTRADDSLGRPSPVLAKGQPIAELF